MEFTTNVIKQVSEHVFSLFRENQNDLAIYHTYTHTLDTVEACEEIGKESKLSRPELEVVIVAAWFHDTGYFESAEDHEEKSAEIAGQFLHQIGYPPEKIEQVKRCICATRVPQQPKDLLEEVICDADIIHMGKKKFQSKGSLLRAELERRQKRAFTDVEWLTASMDFISRHTFHTPYAQEEYGKQRTKNLLALQEQLREAESEQEQVLATRKTKKDKMERERIPLRGIDTMIRQTTSNHIHFSTIADHKASMLISTNSLMMTLIVTLYGRGILGEERVPPFVLMPILALMTVALATITFAILSTRPKVTTGTFSKEDIMNRKANLLFFGNFYKMELADFEFGMREIMRDADTMHDTLIRDIYFLGKVLGKRFEYLRISYNIFMFGLIATLLIFVVMYLVY